MIFKVLSLKYIRKNQKIKKIKKFCAYFNPKINFMPKFDNYFEIN